MSNTSSIKASMIKENAFVQRRSNWSLLPAHLRRQQLADKESLDNGDATDESWWEKVQDLELNSRKLRKLSNLERLVNLKVLSVCDNEILAIQGLERHVCAYLYVGVCVCVCARARAYVCVKLRAAGGVANGGKPRILFFYSCVLLEELLMEENRISKIENLSTLMHLKTLMLSRRWSSFRSRTMK